MSAAKKFAEMKRTSIENDLRCRQKAGNNALKIVLYLMDGQIHPQALIEAADSLNPQYYSDLTEERGLAFICGYPLCGQKLKPKKHAKYHISTQTNKVYDMSERKNFCSGMCFKASKFFENQLSEEPLWLRFASPGPVQLLESSCQNVPDKSVLIQSLLAGGDDDTPEVDAASALLDQLALNSDEIDKIEIPLQIHQEQMPTPSNDTELTVAPNTNEHIQTLSDSNGSFDSPTVDKVHTSVIKEEEIITHLSKRSTSIIVDTDSLTVRERSISTSKHLVDNVDLDKVGTLKIKTVEGCFAAPVSHTNSTKIRHEPSTDKTMRNLKEWISKNTIKFMKRDSEGLSEESNSTEPTADAKVTPTDASEDMQKAHSYEPYVTVPGLTKVEAQRRHIALRKLNTCLHQISIHAPEIMEYTQPMRNLVNTFRLTSENICLHTSDWTYATVLCVYMCAGCRKEKFHPSILDMIPVKEGPRVSKLIDAFDDLHLCDD